MQISITNGTVERVQETLSASSGYQLPNSVTVVGATSEYDSSTGSLTLTNLTENISISADAIPSTKPPVEYDLAQLQLPVGNHSVMVRLKADGYEDSNDSNVVFYEVQEGGRVTFHMKRTLPQSDLEVGGIYFSKKDKSNKLKMSIATASNHAIDVNGGIFSHNIEILCIMEESVEPLLYNIVAITSGNNPFASISDIPNGYYTASEPSLDKASFIKVLDGNIYIAMDGEWTLAETSSIQTDTVNEI